MIAIKTKMSKIPKACRNCSYYIPSTATIYGTPCCGAIPGYRNRRSLPQVSYGAVKRSYGTIEYVCMRKDYDT